MCLAEWRMTGHQIRRDLTEARRLYGIAAESMEEARSPYLALLANGAGGCERAWQQALHELYEARTEDEARQRALICAMDIDEVGNPTGPFEFERPIPSAHISVFKSFLGDDECEYLQAIARPRLQRAMVVDPKTGQLIYDPVRKSSFTSSFVDENPVIHALNRRLQPQRRPLTNRASRFRFCHTRTEMNTSSICCHNPPINELRRSLSIK